MSYIFLALLLLAAAVLCVKIRLVASLDGGFSCHVKILGFKIKLLPQKKEIPLPQETGQVEETAEKGVDYLSLALDIAGNKKAFIRKRVRLEKLDLDLGLGVDDAAKTAVMTGLAWGLVYNILGLLDRIIELCAPRINIFPIYNDPRVVIKAEAVAATNLAHILSIAFVIALKWFKYKREVKKNGRQASD